MKNWADLHHATILVGSDFSEVFSDLENNLKFPTKGNPDFFHREYDSFGIDESRELVTWVSGKPLLTDRKLALLLAPNITLEAQNALLKTLEEPPVGTYIIFGLPNVGSLLPTLLSRVRVVELAKSLETEKKENEAIKFMKAGVGERLAQIKLLSKKEDKTQMKNLIRDLEKASVGRSFEDRKKILTAKVFAASRGASPKMLLEWLAML